MSFAYKLLFILGLWVIDIAKAQDAINTPLVTSSLEQGIFTSAVRKIIKDKNGFLWFATQDGLHKYDGNVTTLFTKDNTSPERNLLGTDCFAMEYEPGEDFLYTLSSYEGLNVVDIQTNRIENQILSEKLSGKKEAVFYEHMTRVGPKIIIVTADKQLVVYNTATQKVDGHYHINLPADVSINDLFTYENKAGIILSNNTFAYLDLNSGKFLYRINCSPKIGGLVTIMTVVNGHEIWLATNQGIYAANLQNGQQIDISRKLPGFPEACFGVNTFMVQQAGDLMFITNNNGIFVYNRLLHSYSKLFANKGEDDIKLIASARSILFTDGQLWMGGPYGIAQVKQLNTVFTPYGKSVTDATIKIGQPYGLSMDKEFLFVAAEDGAYKVNTKTSIIERLTPDLLFFSTGYIGGGKVLLSGVNKLLLYNNGTLQNPGKVYQELMPIITECFISIKQLTPSKILLLSQLQKALYLWDMELHTLKAYNTQSDLPIADLSFNNILVINKDSIFVVSEKAIQLINFRENTTKVVFRMEQLGKEKSGVFMDMCRQGNNYWVAGYGLGILKLNAQFQWQEWLKTKDGINNLGLYKIFSAGDSLIVVTSNSGLICYNSRQRKLRTYYGADGLQSGSFNEASGCQHGDSIYVGGLNGISLFNTKNYQENNKPPQLYFNTLSYKTEAGIKDTTNLFIKDFEIPNNATQTKITFTGLNYINPERVTYQYRIKELQNEWTDNKFQNFITPIATPPGTYTLEVKAANEDGVECVPISMTLHFLPKWYQTWLFKMAVVLAIAGLLYALYSFRIRQLKRIISVRQKISSDLHDDIGSTLSTINMYSQVAQLHGPGHVPIMHNIQENAQEVLEKLDDIVWSTNPKNDQVKNLVERIDAFARPLLQAKEIQFVFNAEDHISSHKIGEATRQNLFLICKEAITNSAKYAECKTCTVSLYKKGKFIHCTITDDGKGFDATQPTERNGLLNMKLRAAAVKGKLEIISSIGNGTSIKVVMPL